MNDAANLIEAIAGFAWPAAFLIVFLIYREEVTNLIRRVRRGKGPGFEFEFDEALDELKRSADDAARSVPPEPRVVAVPSHSARAEEAAAEPADGDSEATEREETARTSTPDGASRRTYTDAPSGGIVVGGTASSELSTADPVRAILADAATSPKVALIALSLEIEREVREILAGSQDPSTWAGRSLGHMLGRLEMGPSVQRAIERFREVRNRIVHGQGASEGEVLRALDSGITILEALRRIPRNVHVVAEPSLEIFADAEGRERREGVHGVGLETRYGDRTDPVAVFPTTKIHFEKGRPVAWEWSFDQTWPESWYRDPETGEIRYAWTNSAEFVGRNLDEI